MRTHVPTLVSHTNAHMCTHKHAYTHAYTHTVNLMWLAHALREVTVCVCVCVCVSTL